MKTQIYLRFSIVDRNVILMSLEGGGVALTTVAYLANYRGVPH